jgi:hypothetical protein
LSLCCETSTGISEKRIDDEEQGIQLDDGIEQILREHQWSLFCPRSEQSSMTLSTSHGVGGHSDCPHTCGDGGGGQGGEFSYELEAETV